MPTLLANHSHVTVIPRESLLGLEERTTSEEETEAALPVRMKVDDGERMVLIRSEKAVTLREMANAKAKSMVAMERKRSRMKNANAQKPIESEKKKEIRRLLHGLTKMPLPPVTASRALLLVEDWTNCKNGNWRKRLERKRELERREKR